MLKSAKLLILMAFTLSIVVFKNAAIVKVLVLSHAVTDSVVADVANVTTVFGLFLQKVMLTSATDGEMSSDLVG